MRAQVPHTRQLVERAFLRLFPDHTWFVEALFIQHRNNGLQHLRGVLALADHYSPEAMVAALGCAREYNTYSHGFIRGLLERGSSLTGTASPASRAGRRVLLSQPSLVGDLGIYQRVLEVAR